MDGVAVKTMIELQMDELQAKYQSLWLEYPHEGNPSVQGILRFHADYHGKEARGEYELRICIPDDYPRSVPSVFETGGRLPEDFHRYSDSSLCLGAPVGVKKTFLASPTLLAFVENLLIPHLFSHAYFAEHGEMPFGELAHGTAGLLDFYKEFFDTTVLSAMRLLKILADGRQRYKGYMPCPCLSTKPVGQCHGPQVEELWHVMPPQHYAKELQSVITYFKKADRDIDLDRFLPHKARRKQNAKLRKQKPR